MEEEYEDVHKTTVSTQIEISDTSIVLANTYEFGESGTIYIGTDTITYTGNTQSTGTLTGCSGVAAQHLVGVNAWQGINPGTPDRYTIFDAKIILDVPVGSDEAGKILKVRYLKALTRFTKWTDSVAIPFTEAISKYIAYKIETRKGNKDNATLLKNEFNEIVSINAKSYKIDTMETEDYYTFDFSGETCDND